jgi:NPCBM/NEW2 domain/Peptidase M60, enhancin and enhancin-like
MKEDTMKQHDVHGAGARHLLVTASVCLCLLATAGAGEKPAAPELVSVTGEHVILEASSGNLKHLKDPKAWVAKLDAAYLAYKDLVGATPYKGRKITVREVARYPGGWAVAGNPIKWHKPYLKPTFLQINKGDWSFGILHELGHDFDMDYSWVWEAEFFANLKMAYVAEKLKIKVHQRKWYDYAKKDGPRLEDYYRMMARKQGAGEVVENWFRHNDPSVHHFLQIKKKIGWEPFKATFREFAKLNRKDIPRDAAKKFNLFAHYLGRFSKQDLSADFIRRGFPVIKIQKGDYLAGLNALGQRLALKTHRGVKGRDLRFECRLVEKRVFKKGLSTYSRSDITFDLEGRYESFEAQVGVDTRVKGYGSVTFDVWLDGKRQFQSGKLTGKDIARRIKLSVAGIKKLRLIVGDAGDGHSSDWADWADAKLIRKDGGVTFLSDIKPVKAKAERGMKIDRAMNGGPLSLEVPSAIKAKLTARLGKQEFTLKGPDKKGSYWTTISGLKRGRHALYVTAELADGTYVLHGTAIIKM